MKYIILIILGTVFTWLLVIHLGSEAVKETTEYQKLFSERKNSLIIGTSRAARLNSDIINDELSNDNLKSGIDNFAFNLAMSPYGSSYNQTIINHVNFKSKEEGLFIICVDPWALAEKKNSAKDISKFPEKSTQINFNTRQQFATLQYFLKTYSKSYYTLFLPQGDSPQKEDKKRPSQDYINKHLSAKMAAYKREHFFDETISTTRLNSLKTLIDTLKTKGTIYIVKLPVSQQMINLERRFSPNFNKKIAAITSEYNLELIDFYNYADLFLCPDGNHLWQPDANKVSAIIADIIKLNEHGLLNKENRDLIVAYLRHNEAKYKDVFESLM